MKYILLPVIMIASAAAGYCQDTAVEKDPAYFIALFTTGERWDTTKQAHEQPYFKEHSLHLAELRKAKKIDIGGRYGETGMIILKAKDEAEALSLIANDVAVKNRLCDVRVFPFGPFYAGCVE